MEKKAIISALVALVRPSFNVASFEAEYLTKAIAAATAANLPINEAIASAVAAKAEAEAEARKLWSEENKAIIAEAEAKATPYLLLSTLIAKKSEAEAKAKAKAEKSKAKAAELSEVKAVAIEAATYLDKVNAVLDRVYCFAKTTNSKAAEAAEAAWKATAKRGTATAEAKAATETALLDVLSKAAKTAKAKAEVKAAAKALAKLVAAKAKAIEAKAAAVAAVEAKTAECAPFFEAAKTAKAEAMPLTTLYEAVAAELAAVSSASAFDKDDAIKATTKRVEAEAAEGVFYLYWDCQNNEGTRLSVEADVYRLPSSLGSAEAAANCLLSHSVFAAAAARRAKAAEAIANYLGGLQSNLLKCLEKGASVEAIKSAVNSALAKAEAEAKKKAEAVAAEALRRFKAVTATAEAAEAAAIAAACKVGTAAKKKAEAEAKKKAKAAEAAATAWAVFEAENAEAAANAVALFEAEAVPAEAAAEAEK